MLPPAQNAVERCFPGGEQESALTKEEWGEPPFCSFQVVSGVTYSSTIPGLLLVTQAE